MEGNEQKGDPPDKGEPQGHENWNEDPQGSAPPTDQVQEAKGELEQEGEALLPSNTDTSSKIGNAQLPKLEMHNKSDESQEEEQGNTPYSDARDVSPLNEDGDSNLSISTQKGPT
ncbi:hypothetical protein JTB14_028964 [Gonioctena quinquepunctata]|nr:hypothetical protein JTB14_028964 [Gonioctena quinquepunctata]